MRREGTIRAAVIFCHSTPFPRLAPHPPATDTLPSLITITIATTIFSIMTRFSTDKIPTLPYTCPCPLSVTASVPTIPQHLTDTINVVIIDIIVIAVLSWSSLKELPVRLLYANLLLDRYNMVVIGAGTGDIVPSSIAAGLGGKASIVKVV